MPVHRRLAPVVRSLLLALLGAVAAVQSLWMLLLGLAMSYGTPLGAPDSDWRGAAGVAMGASAVLFGSGVAALALPRHGLAVLGVAAGSALYTAVYLAYPGLSGADAWTWATLAAPWAITAAVLGIALRQRGSGVAPADAATTSEPAQPIAVA